MQHRARRSGYTLIELLVVMAIISILVALIVTVVVNVRENAQIAATNAAIQVIVTAMDAYKNEYHAFPPVYIDFLLEPGEAVSAGALGDKGYLRRNEVLYQWLTERFVAVGKESAKGPFLTEEKIKNTVDLGGAAGQVEFADAWGEPLVYLMPGVDHTGEVDVNLVPIAARDSTMLKQVGQFDFSGDWDVDTGKFDIYSLGPNGIDDSKLSGSIDAGSYDKLDKYGDGNATWGATYAAYTAIKTSKGVGDDIASWKFNTKKSSNN